MIANNSQSLAAGTLPPDAAPDISVSIVSYNTRDLLRACLHSLRERSRDGEVSLEVIVADNGSLDGSVEMIAAEFPEVRCIHSGGNVGYGRANNKALEAANGRYFLVLNSDTEVEPGALKEMRDFMDAHPEVGAAGAQLVLPDGSTQPSCGMAPGLMSVLWEQTYLYKLLPGNAITGGYNLTHWNYDERREVEQVCGACLFVRREAWRQIGGFDPKYFMYFEDTDFCVRLRRAGWSIYYLPAARILHHLGGSSVHDWRTRARMVSSYNQSRYYYFSRNEGHASGTIIKMMTVLGALLRLSGWTFLALIRPSAHQKVLLFRDVLRRTWRMTTHNESTQNLQS